MEKHVLVDWQSCLHLTGTGLGLVQGAFFTLQLRGASYFAHLSVPGRVASGDASGFQPIQPTGDTARRLAWVRIPVQCLSPHS